MYRIGQEEIEAAARVIHSKQLFKCNYAGQENMHCEEEIKEKFSCTHTIIMTSGKAAIISALAALGIGPGDEVIVPAYTYIATAIAVIAVGAIPVVCDIDESMTIDPADAERRISSATKAIIPVHIQGFPCDMDRICALAEKYNLKIVEDACQADGGSYHGKRLGTIGAAGALSFNHFKIITSGEGGALLTDDRALYERALIYHDSSAVAYFGNQLDTLNTETFCGSEYRTNEINAAILREQLKKLDGILCDLRKNKKIVMEALAGQYKFAESYDTEGDCGTTLAFRFDSEEQARRFAESDGVKGVLPIDTGKHVYIHWTAIVEKRGAINPLMDPFRHPANSKLNANYSEETCAKSLDILAKTVYISVNPDWTDEEISAVISSCKNAK